MLEEVWFCWIELFYYLDFEIIWLNILEEWMKSIEVLFEKMDVVNEVLEFLEFVLCYLVDNCIQI